jgi:hypothetical protein
MNHGLTHNKPSHFDSDAMTSVEQPRHQKVSVLRGLVPFSSPPSSVNIISIAFTKLLKHNNSNQQPTPPHQSTCLPTSDPAAPTRLVTRYDRPTHMRHILIQSTNTLQRTVSDAEIKAQQEANRFHEGKENSHKANDSSTFPRDPRSTWPETIC